MTEAQEQAAGIEAPRMQTAPLKYIQHLIIGLAIAVVAPFTLFAWPFAILTGIVIGRSEVERTHGIRAAASTTIVRLLAVTGGVLAMLVFGAILGGLIGFIVAAFAALSERVAADASPTDRSIARVLIFLVAVVGWFAITTLLGTRVDLRIGG
ncbi:MAG TPA: hypothetical protein VK871_13105 [Candidatus Limnocylindrales bacterium]|nr:hypothetical protein [Candidatus Limnocylindrales bacterium]